LALSCGNGPATDDCDKERSRHSAASSLNIASASQPRTASVLRGRSIGLTARLEACGHNALEARAASAYEEFVAPGDFSFRRRDNVEGVADVVKLNWEMVAANGEVGAVGLEFLVLDPHGRIRRR
jgi:hypothetical protein